MKKDRSFIDLARAIARRESGVAAALKASPSMATAVLAAGATRQTPSDFFIPEILHYVYGGDTLLHVAAACYSIDVARTLVNLGADVRAANRRGAQPLHYATDGGPRSPTCDPRAQAAMVTFLIRQGADPNARDRSGVAPLHRAARTRCTAAVKALLEGGADPSLTNKNGSTPARIAASTTGRGGSGTPEAKAEQARILALLARP